MSVTIKDNTPLILAKNNQAVNLALRLTMDGIDKSAFPKTPKDRGELRKNIRKSVSAKKGRIEWSSRYAQYQERGYSSGPIRHYTTPGTGAHFAENAVNANKSTFPDMYRRAM